jgi:hypothetical protein
MIEVVVALVAGVVVGTAVREFLHFFWGRQDDDRYEQRLREERKHWASQVGMHITRYDDLQNLHRVEREQLLRHIADLKRAGFAEVGNLDPDEADSWVIDNDLELEVYRSRQSEREERLHRDAQG